MTFPARLLLAAVAGVALVAASLPVAHAQANEALDEIDELVHQWDDGSLTAEAALEGIEEIIHDVPATERVGALLEIDEVVHHWEDGEIASADEAMTQIEAIVHGGDGVDHAAPEPASTGNAGLVRASGSAAPALALLMAAALVVGAARVVTVRDRS